MAYLHAWLDAKSPPKAHNRQRPKAAAVHAYAEAHREELAALRERAIAKARAVDAAAGASLDAPHYYFNPFWCE